MAEIHLVRHGQASFVASDYDELSPLGHEQARLLGAWWRQRGRVPDRVLHGGMKRHRQTAEGFLHGLGLAHRIEECAFDAGLAEFDHVDVVSRLRPDLPDHAAIAHWVESSEDPPRMFNELFRNGVARWTSGQFNADYRESWPVFRDRCQAALQRVLDESPQGSVTVVITSGGPISVTLHKILGMTDEELFHRSLLHDNCGTTQLNLWPGGEIVPGAINETPHLRVDGRDLVTLR